VKAASVYWFTVVVGLLLARRSMRFAINTDAVNRSGVRSSSRLLGYATIVRDADER
jgi:hypothetical protein